MRLAQKNPIRGLTALLNEGRLLNEFLAFAQTNWIDTSHIRPSANPRKILLIPGFLASDLSLEPLARCLRRAGHHASFSGIWCNADCPRTTMQRLENQLTSLTSKAGEKVVLVGHSLGGIYARELARRHPESVERAFLLGSPLRDPWNSSSLVVKMLALGAIAFHGRRSGCSVFSLKLCGIDVEGEPPPVPETIIYSKSDGVVQWESCLEQGSQVETVEVESSHCGLACSSGVLKILLERLGARAARQLALAWNNPTPALANHESAAPIPALRLVRARRSAA